MSLVAWPLELASRRNIRSRRDLWLYVVRMTLYISFLSMIVTGIQQRGEDVTTIVASVVGVGIACVILALPITWEFGRMYLDLWTATQSLHALARTDQQTGLLNNRSFVALIEERLEAGREVALLLGDLDRFKSINDRHGHLKGDEVIAAVGAVMRGLFAEPAPIGRMGGEEFAIALDCPFSDPRANLRYCEAFAEELRKRVGAIRIESGREVIAPTISIGIARSSDVGGFSDLYARADKALYVAKAAGRNRTVDETVVDFVGPPRRCDAEPCEVHTMIESLLRSEPSCR